MKLNPDCIRDILLYLEDNLRVKNNSFSFISLETLQNNLTQYSKEDIFYSVYNLREIHYIEGTFLGADNIKMYVCLIDNITYAGHQFLDTVKPETVWNKTKSIVKQAGIHTLEFIETIAHDIAVESAKEMIKASMNGGTTS